MRARPSPCSDELGMSLVEVMVSMAIFALAAAGLGYALTASSRQQIHVEYTLQNQQAGMEGTLAGGTVGAGTVSGTLSGTATVTSQTVPVPITSPSAGTSSTVSVPVASLSSTYAALNQQPPVWWQP